MTDEPIVTDPEDAESAVGIFERAPDGQLRWPAPDRDSFQLGSVSGTFEPDKWLAVFLQMDGHHGRSDADVKVVTGQEIDRPRRLHKLLERIGILYPGEGVSRLSRLGRVLREASHPDGMRRVVALEALDVLWRYQINNPVERGLPEDCEVHPYYVVLKAASGLDWRIHWDELNRELMRITRDDQVDDAINRIAEARKNPTYPTFIGGGESGPGLLNARTHPAAGSAPAKKTPAGQLRDQRMTPFLKRTGFGELLLTSPGKTGLGYWQVPEPMRDLVTRAVSRPPEAKRFSEESEWAEWFCEGTTRTTNAPPKPRLEVATAVGSLTLGTLRKALVIHEPDLVFSDALLASVVAALRSGDGKNFIILKGLSGTGKTRLVTAVAKAVYGSPAVKMPELTIVEVRPDWSDGSYLLGHYDPISRSYVRERFLDALLAADAAWRADGVDAAPVFVCLDEMNLARVEYYLSDCLSAMESGSPIALDTRGDPGVPETLIWPPNLYLFGTVNVDESTHRISDKVLDRAQVVDTSDIALLPQLAKWLQEQPHLDAPERERVLHVVGGTWAALGATDAQFGFRTARAIARYVAESKASSDGVVTIDDAIDMQLMQKVLVKLRGEGQRWEAVLTGMEDLLETLNMGGAASLATVRRMRGDLERLGSFQFWA